MITRTRALPLKIDHAGALAKRVGRGSWHGYVFAILTCSLTTVVALPLSGYFDLANIVMLFLLAVVLVAVRFGRGPAVGAAFLSVAMFDFFLVPPQFSFAVNDAQYMLTFTVMLTVALVIGQLAAGLKREADVASLRELRSRALYEMSRELAGALQVGQVEEIACHFLRDTLNADSLLLLAGGDGALTVPADPQVRALNLEMARAAFSGGPCADLGAQDPVGYFPLKAPARVRGVLVVAFDRASTAALNEHRELLEAVASLAAIAVERIHYVDVANRAELQMISERLRSSILSAVSHDLRTPLTVLVGLADALAAGRPPLTGQQRDSAQAIRNQAIRLNGLVAKLLDMARLNAGEVKLRREWQPLEEVIGASIKLLDTFLVQHPVNVQLSQKLPLIEFDAVLIERVFCNLLENAAKYSPAGSAIGITAQCTEMEVTISVCDHGPGIAPAQAASIFEMFVRGTRESATPGVGLGLAICRAIVEAHGGTIHAANRPQGGACFVFTLPTGSPPAIEPEDVARGSARD